MFLSGIAVSGEWQDMSKKTDILSLLIDQRDSIRSWLDQASIDAPTEQRHLVEDTAERVYWHHGYQAALDDILRHFTATSPSGCNSGKPN